MKYEIKWQKKATKQLLKLERSTQSRIMEAVKKLRDSATWTNVKAISSSAGRRLPGAV